MQLSEELHEMPQSAQAIRRRADALHRAAAPAPRYAGRPRTVFTSLSRMGPLDSSMATSIFTALFVM